MSLFPRLKSLNLDIFSRRFDAALCQLVSRPLEYIKLSMTDDDFETGMRLAEMIGAIRRSDSLRYLHLDITLALDGADEDPKTEFSVLRLQVLRLYVTDASPILLDTANFASLEGLALVFESHSSNAAPYSFLVKEFPSLRAFSILSDKPVFHTCRYLLESVCSTSLAEFSYSFEDASDIGLHDIFQTLATTWPATITKIEIRGRAWSPAVVKEGLFRSLVLLAACKHMQTLCVGYAHPYLELSDQQLEVLASA